MSRGHGAPGLLDNLRTFADLVDDSGASRRPYLEFFPGVALTTGWNLSSGAAYQYNGLINQTFSGVLLDVVGVETSLGALTRVESLADCIAQAGTFYAAAMFGAPAETVPQWDDGTLWDAAGVTWDHATFIDLYVHLAGDANPNAATVVPLLGLFFGARGEVHPQLGPDKLTNGGFENLTGWNERTTPGWDDGVTLWDGSTTWDSSPITSALDSVVFTGRGSTSSLKLVSSGTAVGNDSRYQDLTTIAGSIYRLSGYYRTDAAFSANLSARLLVGNTAGTTILYSDGRDGDASGQVTLTPTGGEWRRFLFDFIAPASTTRVQLQLAALAAAGAGQLNFDGVSLKRVYRYVYYEPRLSADSIPEVEVGSQSIFFAGKTDGQGRFSLINADGALEALFAQLLTAGKTATVYIGGHFFTDGREVYRDDWRGAWPGRAQKLTCTDATIDFESDDARDALHVQLPTRVHSLTTEPNLNLNDEGSGRAILFSSSAANAVKPTRVDVTASGYGVYEVGDGGASLAGVPAQIKPPPAYEVPNIWVYPSEDLATKDSLGFKYAAGVEGYAWYPGGPPSALVPVSALFSYDAALGRITVLDDVRNYLCERDGTVIPQLWLDFNIGGAATEAIASGMNTVQGAPGYLSANMLAATLQERFRFASGAADIFVDYSHTTHLWTIRKTAGTLNLLCATGQFKHLRGYDYLGFDTSTDKTGALSYTGTTPTFTSPESDHVLRAVSYGLKDDTAGTITGTPSAVVSKHADVAKYVLYQYLRIPSSQIDSTSFAAGAALETTALVEVSLKERMSSRDFLTRLEAGAIADLVIDGDSIWRWKPYSASAPVVQDFFDRDYIDFSLTRDPKNIYSSARVTYGQNPARASDKAYEYVADSGIPTKHRRLEVLPIETWIGASTAQDAAAQLVAQRYARLAAANPRIAAFTARGKLTDVLQGDIIRLTRTRGLDSSGSLNAVRFRVMSGRQNLLAGFGACVAVEDVPFLS
jgi:hypothetical protein